MQERTKIIFAGAFIGFTAAGMMALPSVLPPAMADDEPVRTMLKTGGEIFPEPLTADAFVKPDEFIYEPWVSTEVLSRQTVRKIAYGRTTFVQISTTASGTYSTDGLASPNFRYPGIHINPSFERSSSVAVWNGQDWSDLAGDTAKSFLNIIPFGGGALIQRNGGCVDVGEAVYC